MANCSPPAAQASINRKPLYIVMNMTIARQRFGKNRLKAGSRSPLARQRFGKHRFPLQCIRW
jgi:hypothetical protein